MENFPVKLKLRIDWSELDMLRHVNNITFLKYVQSSRVNYWEQIDLTGLYNNEKKGPMLVSTSIQYLKPLYYPGNVTVQARVEFIKNTSFGIHHQIIDDNNEVAAEAHDVAVIFDFNINSKIPFPDSLRQKIEEIENKTFVKLSN